MNTLTAVPAYGRDYKSKQEVLEDFNKGKDFAQAGINARGGMYFNKSDIPGIKRDGITHISFRYSKLTKVFLLKL